MEFLNAALAFTVLMITFSTAATGLSEAALRFFSQRPRVLASALMKFIKTDPRLKEILKRLLDDDTLIKGIKRWLDELKTGAADEAAKAKKNLERILGPFVTPEEAERLYSAYRADRETEIAEKATAHLLANPAAGGDATSFKAANSVDTLTTYAFVQRLAETDIGKALGADISRKTLQALTRGFERFTAASNEVFRKRARSMTMTAALFLAFIVNIPAGPIFNYVLENPELASAIADEAETKIEESKSQIEAFNDRIAALNLAESKGEDFNNNEQAELTEAVATAEAAVADMTKILSDARGLYDLPLGYKKTWFAETCTPPATPLTSKADPSVFDDIAFFVAKAAEDTRACLRSGTFRFWAVNVLLSGLLIGLGGPFWYRVYSSLSQSAQLVRILGGSARPETVGAGSSASQPVHASLAADVADTEGEGEGGSKSKEASVDDQLLSLFKLAHHRDASADD